MAATRRLAVIMFTDTVGYTAAVQSNEAGALKQLREQEELVCPLFSAHRGRVVKSTGDGFMVEFESALNAVQCAIDILHRLHERNSQRGVSPIQLRIGVHLGDVEQHGSDIFGDSVNIAARLEPLAEAGGICVSEPVFSQVRNKIPNRLEKLESRTLKNVRFPIDIYRVVLPWTEQQKSTAGSGPTRLAVLPFANISPDPNDAYFADGLTEEMITVLSQLRELRVIARTSVDLYKSTPKSVSQIGADLGVSAVLEGSVRKSGEDLRITVQLIDVDSQEHLWAATYDRKLEKVFTVQAELAREVASALKLELQAGDWTRLEKVGSVRPDSYLAYLRGQVLSRTQTRATLAAAKEQFRLAISLDERNAAAHASLSTVTYEIGLWYTDSSQREWVDECRRAAARSIELDPGLAEAHASLATILWDDLDYARAEAEFTRTLSLNPSLSHAHASYAILLQDLNRPDEALVECSSAEAADPLWSVPLYHHARLLIWLRRLDEARDLIGKLEALGSPDSGYYDALAWYSIATGHTEQALEAIREVEARVVEARNRPVERAWHLIVEGKSAQARAVLGADPGLADFGQNAHSMASLYARLGDLDDCFRLMERAIEVNNLPIYPYRIDPDLESVRMDPRFPGLLRKLKLV